MNKSQYAEYLTTNHWKNLRRSKLELAGYACEQCGSRYYLQVHHLSYQNIFDVKVSDLKVLCRYCHEKEHGIVSNHRPIHPEKEIPQKRVRGPSMNAIGKARQVRRKIRKILRSLPRVC